MGVLEDGPVPDRGAVLRRSLERAIELADTPSYEHYASGLHGFGKWIEGLRDERKIAELPKQTLLAHQIANGHVFASLCDARAAACDYLAEIAPELDAATARRAAAARERYEQARALLSERSPAELAPMPWHPQPWTAELRRAQADVLERVLAVERRAVDCLRN